MSPTLLLESDFYEDLGCNNRKYCDTFRRYSIQPALAETSQLAHYSAAPFAKLVLAEDASQAAVGAALQQMINGETRPLAFFSKRLQPAQTRYSTFGRELLAAYLAVKHFRHALEGRQFTLLTDHKPPTYALENVP